MNTEQTGLLDYRYAEPLDFTEQIAQGRGFNIGLPSILFSILIFVLAGGAYLTDLKFAAAIIAGLWVIILTLVSPGAGIAFLLSFQVMDLALNPEEGGGYEWISPVRVISILCIIAYVIHLMFHKSDIKAGKKPLFIFYVFLAFAFIPMIFSEYKLWGLLAITKIAIQVFLIIVAVDYLAEPKRLYQTLLFLVIGNSLGTIFIMFSGVAVSAEAESRIVIAGVGVNTLGISLGAFIIAAIVLLIWRPSITSISISIIGLLIMTLGVFRTGTRSVVVSVPLSIVFGALVGYWRRLHKLLLIVSFGLFLTGGLFIWAINSDYIRGDLRDRLITIFSSETYKENVRWHLWAGAIKIYLNHPMGVGPGNEMIYYIMETGEAKTMLEAHNTFLSILIEYNLIGLLLFLWALMTIGKSVLKIKHSGLRASAAMLFAFCIINAMKGTMHETRIFWQPIMLVMIMIEADSRLKRNAEEPNLYSEDSSINSYDYPETV